MTTTPATTTPATTPDRYPRYCAECGEGMRTGYQHEEDTNLTYCSLECAADGFEMTVEEMEEAKEVEEEGMFGLFFSQSHLTFVGTDRRCREHHSCC